MQDQRYTAFRENFRLLLATGFGLTQRRLDKENVLPRHLGNFVLREEILREKPGREYAFGLYQNQYGARALAKLLLHPSNRLAAYWLKNEIRVYRILQRVIEAHPEGKRKFPHVHIPKLLDARESEHQPLILLEYIEGVELGPLGAQEQARVFSVVLEYLNWLGKVIATNSPFSLKERSVWHILVLFPAISLRALWRFPRSSMLILRTIREHLLSLPVLFKQSTVRFSHRDLGPHNVLVRGVDVWILDFQIAALADPLFDLVSLALKLQDTKEIKTLVMGSPFAKTMLSTPESLRKFHALALHLSLYNLSLSSGRSATSVAAFLMEQFSSLMLPHFSFGKWSHRLWNTVKEQVYILMYSPSETVQIEPFNPEGRILADALIAKIQALAPELRAHLIGSVSMGIAGQRDIDIFVECQPSRFPEYRKIFVTAFGEPTREKTAYLEWEFSKDEWKIEILLIDPTSEKFKSQTEIVWAIQRNPVWLAEYEALKLSLNGTTLRNYERAKHHFLNKIRRATSLSQNN